MNKLSLVSFSADFPDDSEWDEQGTEIVPGGRNIIDSIRGRLQEKGISCCVIEQHSYYGWAFDVVFDDSKIWFLLTIGGGGWDSWLVQLVPRRSVISRLLGRPETAGFETIQRNLHDILVEDKRFFGIKWYARADYDRCNEEAARDSPY